MKLLPAPLKDLSRLTLACVLMTCATATSRAAEAIVWHAESETMDVDIDNKPLASVAADFQKATGRSIHIPPGVTKTVSLKFSGKPMGEGLSKILDGLNYHSEGTGAETHIVVLDPSGATTTGPVRSVASMPRPVMPIAPVNTVYKPPGKDSGKGGSARGGDTSGAGGTGGGRTERAVEAIMRAAGGDAGGGSGTRDSGSKRSGGTGSTRPGRGN